MEQWNSFGSVGVIAILKLTVAMKNRKTQNLLKGDNIGLYFGLLTMNSLDGIVPIQMACKKTIANHCFIGLVRQYSIILEK